MPYASTLPRNFNSASHGAGAARTWDNNLKPENSLKREVKTVIDPYGNVLINQSVPTPIDTLSINSRQSNGFSLNGSMFNQSQQQQLQRQANLDRRNKYNTLTPAEAKKINRFLIGRQMPARTASVLAKPRPPPVNVAHLDQRQLTNNNRTSLQPLGNINGLPNGNKTASCVRSNSINYTRSEYLNSKRHSMNYGQMRPNNQCSTLQRNNNQKHTTSASISPNDSDSATSFKSSLEIADSAYGSARLQTMSVDLGRPNVEKKSLESITSYGSTNLGHSQTQSRISDESYSSAKSEQSDRVDNYDKVKSASKMSLSSSTSRVFQNQLSSLKKFFRNMPLRKTFSSSASNSTTDLNNQRNDSTSNHGNRANENESRDMFTDSISQIFNRSLSPLSGCPPPPDEPKSMPFIVSNSNNYSNYDEFTKTRNEQSRNKMLNKRSNNIYCQLNEINDHRRMINDEHLGSTDQCDSGSWQLTSLPVSYERNLATVFEERQNSAGDLPVAGINLLNNKQLDVFRKNNDKSVGQNAHVRQPFIDPPNQFEDITNRHKINHQTSNTSSSTTNSSHSLTSTTTADSVLDYHRQTPATPFRFSFAQPSPTNDNVSATPLRNLFIRSKSKTGSESVVDNPRFRIQQQLDQKSTCSSPDGTTQSNLLNLTNLSQSLRSLKSPQGIINQTDTGLPPRIPIGASCNDSKQDTSSGASSSNSSVMNGANYCDQQSDKLSYQNGDLADYGNSNGLSIDNTDADTTIMSDTSTLQGDYNTLSYMNKCSELERTILGLKEKVVLKEKEITDLQLEQINSEYLIEQLKKTVSKLEKDNAHLRAIVMNGAKRVDL